MTLRTPTLGFRAIAAVGIDVAEERKGLDLVALAGDRSIVVSVGRLTPAAVVDLVLNELRPDVVCIDSPSAWSRSGRSREAERELRRLGITAFSTGPDPGDHAFYRWMRVGMALYESLSAAYPLHRGGDLRGTAVEVFPEASAVVLAGRHRDGDESKETFRRAVLAGEGVDERSLPTIDRVDAALAALTGLLALDGVGTTIGDPDEGVLLLPTAELPSAPFTREPARNSGPITPSVRAPDIAGSGLCLCGCGAPVRRRFLPGHDAKLKSQLLDRHRAGDEGATERLRELGWLDIATAAAADDCYSTRFDVALSFAAQLHRTQRRKATKIPYVAHILSVAALVWECADEWVELGEPIALEDVAIAGLLHDAAEDQGGTTVLREIEARFGSVVSSMVEECSDTFESPKPPWRARKEGHVAHLARASVGAHLVVAADKIHNITSVIEDYVVHGASLWGRFGAPNGPEDVLWYYDAICEVLESSAIGELHLVERLRGSVDRLGNMACCPVCGNWEVVPIVYGLPDIEAADAEERGEIALGGCVASPEQPERLCRSCGYEWAAGR
ncbi:MAG: DUF429 domain-containing protein [Acidimicrobiales bacterium]